MASPNDGIGVDDQGRTPLLRGAPGPSVGAASSSGTSSSSASASASPNTSNTHSSADTSSTNNGNNNNNKKASSSISTHLLSSSPPLAEPSLPSSLASRLPLRTSGRNIIDRSGQRFRLQAVNWYGASDAYHIVGGLDCQSLDVICNSVAELGFNCVRLPFSNEMLRRPPAEGSIDFKKNPELKGLSALEVFDKVINALGERGLAVIINNHTTYSEWCGGPDRNGLWFVPGSSEYTEERWIEDWVLLAKRYSKCRHVIGCDLRNEVRFSPWPFAWPSVFGSCAKRCLLGQSWPDAAAMCAEEVVKVHPDCLIIVERIIWPMGDLGPYAESPGPLLPKLKGRLVLGVHHYSWNGPGRYLAFSHTMSSGWRVFLRNLLRNFGIFSEANYGDMSRGELTKEIFRQWGFLLASGTCPVWVSEFGACEEEGSYDMVWLERFLGSLEALEADFAYWPLNVGPKPGSGHGEPYGLLGPDWKPRPEWDPRIDLMRKYGLLPKP